MQEPVFGLHPDHGHYDILQERIAPTEFDAAVNGENWHNGVHMGHLPFSALLPVALDDLALGDLQLGLVQEDLEHGVLVVADRIETAALDF